MYPLGVLTRLSATPAKEELPRSAVFQYKRAMLHACVEKNGEKYVFPKEKDKRYVTNVDFIIIIYSFTIMLV